MELVDGLMDRADAVAVLEVALVLNAFRHHGLFRLPAPAGPLT